jgi:acetoin:2,6-dichlorophenolindophenol oxidoreductase subunit alpha
MSESITLDREVQKILYRKMLLIRMVEEKVADLYTEQEMKCPCHLSTGQEAIPAAISASFEEGDALFGTYRGHGIYLAQGGDLKALIAELYGKVTGCTRGKGGSMQLIAPEVGLVCTSAIVGGTIPIAVGAAMSASMKGNDRVAVVTFGEGATEEGVFHESLNFAALKKLPVVFVCEHNSFATYSHQDARQVLDNVYERAAVYGIPSTRFDGNNVVESYAAINEAFVRARRGEGPSLVEGRTYRWLEHVGPYSDIDLGYRSQEELDLWVARCPIEQMAKTLLEGGIAQEEIEGWRTQIASEIEDAVTFAQESPFPDVAEMSQDVYYESKEA